MGIVAEQLLCGAAWHFVGYVFVHVVAVRTRCLLPL